MVVRVLVIAIAVAAGACEKTTHENIDKWKRTEKGASKLESALSDDTLDADLSAHAGANLVERSLASELASRLAAMPAARRTEVVGKLAPRLWNLARVENDNAIPGPVSVAAKDALYGVRKYADDTTRAQIDGYLVDWFAVISYAGRARRGAVTGAQVMRTIGPSSGKKMIEVANAIVGAPGQTKVRNRVDDELMLGLAATQDPTAVGYVVDLARMDRGDATLPTRAMDALYMAFVDPAGELDAVAPPAPLAPSLDKLAAIAESDRMPPHAANDALGLIRAIGPPKCVPLLIAMIPHPHASPLFKAVAAGNAIECGGVPAIAPVARALPHVAFAERDLQDHVVAAIARVGPRADAIAALRELLGDGSPMARWVAIEGLAALKSADDAPRIAALARAGDRLLGFWGDEGKPDPTLGQRAKELAGQLANAPK